MLILIVKIVSYYELELCSGCYKAVAQTPRNQEVVGSNPDGFCFLSLSLFLQQWVDKQHY